MPAKDTVCVQLSTTQAFEAAHWLNEYQPVPPPYRMGPAWESDQRQIACELGQILRKAAIRKRSSATLNLRIRRELAQWFASFARPDGSWDFDGVFLPGQPAPKHIQTIAALFQLAASGRRGRRLLSLLETEKQLERSAKAGADPRVVRRLRNETKPEREWAKKEIDAAGPEPEA
jgi:hypothetical protein